MTIIIKTVGNLHLFRKGNRYCIAAGDVWSTGFHLDAATALASFNQYVASPAMLSSAINDAYDRASGREC